MYDVNTWVDPVRLSLQNTLSQFLNFLPNLIGAILIFVVGLLIASLVKEAVMRVLSLAQLEPFAERVGLNRVLRSIGAQITAQEVLGEIIRWAIVIIFLLPASDVLGLTQLSNMINALVAFIPNVIVAVIVLMVGAILADIVGEVVGGTSQAIGASTANVLAVTSKYAIIVFSVLVALSQLKVAENIIYAIVVGVVGMFALAGGLAFGLGGQKTAAEILDSLKQNLRERR